MKTNTSGACRRISSYTAALDPVPAQELNPSVTAAEAADGKVRTRPTHTSSMVPSTENR